MEQISKEFRDEADPIDKVILEIQIWNSILKILTVMNHNFDIPEEFFYWL